MRRRGAWVALGCAGLVAVVGAAVAASVGVSWHHDPAATTSPSPAATATVTQQTLVDYVTVDGRVGYGAGWPVRGTAEGTVTWLPATGTTIHRGRRCCASTTGRWCCSTGPCPCTGN